MLSFKRYKKYALVPGRVGFSFLLITVFLLSACEAPLDLTGVEASRSAPIRRTDVFMAVTNSGVESIVVGFKGVVITATAGTENWQRRQVEGNPTFIDIANCPQGLLVAVTMEGDVWTSGDHGRTWKMHDPGTSEIPQAVACDQQGVIWVVGSFSMILSSPDSGKTWDDHSLGEDIILSTVQFIDGQNGIITGEFGTVLSTKDGGASWEFSGPIPNEFFPLSGVFQDLQQGWVVGLNGTIYATLDGGVTWQREKTHINAPLFDVSVVDGTVVAVGDYGTVVQRKTGRDQATDWELLEIPVKSRFFFRVIHPSGDSGIIVAGGAGALNVIDLDDIDLAGAGMN